MATGALFFPDFTLCRDGARVHVEVVRFGEPAHLVARVEAIRAAKVAAIFCVQGSTAPFEAPEILHFPSKPNAAELLDAAERLVQ